MILWKYNSEVVKYNTTLGCHVRTRSCCFPTSNHSSSLPLSLSLYPHFFSIILLHTNKVKAQRWGPRQAPQSQFVDFTLSTCSRLHASLHWADGKANRMPGALTHSPDVFKHSWGTFSTELPEETHTKHKHNSLPTCMNLVSYKWTGEEASLWCKCSGCHFNEI